MHTHTQTQWWQPNCAHNIVSPHRGDGPPCISGRHVRVVVPTTFTRNWALGPTPEPLLKSHLSSRACVRVFTCVCVCVPFWHNNRTTHIRRTLPVGTHTHTHTPSVHCALSKLAGMHCCRSCRASCSAAARPPFACVRLMPLCLRLTLAGDTAHTHTHTGMRPSQPFDVLSHTVTPPPLMMMLPIWLCVRAPMATMSHLPHK